jgi:hypothetical protein
LADRPTPGTEPCETVKQGRVNRGASDWRFMDQKKAAKKKFKGVRRER